MYVVISYEDVSLIIFHQNDVEKGTPGQQQQDRHQIRLCPGRALDFELKHLRLSSNITCKPLPQYHWQYHSNRLLAEIFL